MDKKSEAEELVLQYIIDNKGDCLLASWCLVCPFQKECIAKSITDKRSLLPKEIRLRKASDRMFNKLIDEELLDGE